MGVDPGNRGGDSWSLGGRLPVRERHRRQLFHGDSTQTSRNQKVAEDIAVALKRAQFHGYEIEIEYKDGVATLTGKVSDPRQKVKANQVVGAVPGVRRLDNRLAVIAAARRCRSAR